MTRVDAWLLHTSNGLVTLTGLLYACMAYLLKPEDPFAVVNHPWQPHMLHAHIIVAPLLVFTLGCLWHRHIWAHYSRGTRSGRRSGIGMIVTALPMILSAYLIQTAVEPEWRTLWVWIHLASSAFWLAGYTLHLVRLMK